MNDKSLEILKTLSKSIKPSAVNKLENLYRKRHGDSADIVTILLDEYSVIKEKKSWLSKDQRDQVTGLIDMCNKLAEHERGTTNSD